jgi:hypothetical protein
MGFLKTLRQQIGHKGNSVFCAPQALAERIAESSSQET